MLCFETRLSAISLPHFQEKRDITPDSAEDPVLQMTARFARDRDRDARALLFELHSTRALLYRALTLLAPFASVGSIEHDAIYPVRTRMPT